MDSSGLIAGVVQAVILLRASTLRERLTGGKIPLRPLVLVGGIVAAAVLGGLIFKLLGGSPDGRASSWLLTLFVLMFVGLRRKLVMVKVPRTPPPDAPLANRPIEAMEDVTVRSETIG